MTQPITSRDPWPIDDASAPPWSPSLPPRGDVSDLPDAAGGLPGGLTSAPAPAVDAPPEVTGATAASVMARRIDAFLELATPTFRTDEGDVSVAIPFHMNTPRSEQNSIATGHAATIADAGRRAGMTDAAVVLVAYGRGSPAQVATLTQELLDEGLLPSDPTKGPDQRIRTMMFDYGIGMDCAGYAQQALLAAQGVTRAAAGLRAPLFENLTGLAQRGYARVSPEDARTGDLFVLRPPPPSAFDPHPVGHTAIVREAHATTVAEMGRLTDAVGVSPEAAANGRWTTMLLDSSWGNGGRASEGGVSRRTFWHEAVSGMWIWTVDAGTVHSGRLPYDHGIDGIYRARGK